MDEFLRRAPRTLLALAAIVIGYILIIGFNPPRTVCDEQLDEFNESQKSFLISPSEKLKKSMSDELFELCKSDNGPGGCFDFFHKMRGFVDGLERIPKSCSETVAADELIKKWLLKSMTLMVQIAWGEAKPESYVSRKLNWLDSADFRLYCRMRTVTIRLYGQDGFEQYRESVLSSLPGADKMTREQKWTRSIFSSPCD